MTKPIDLEAGVLPKHRVVLGELIAMDKAANLDALIEFVDGWSRPSGNDVDVIRVTTHNAERQGLALALAELKRLRAKDGEVREHALSLVHAVIQAGDQMTAATNQRDLLHAAALFFVQCVEDNSPPIAHSFDPDTAEAHRGLRLELKRLEGL